MTATADTRALLAACRTAPQDAHAVLLLADAIYESGRERDAAYLRCTADPDNDAHRHALASLWERGDPERAELVRVQCELARHGPPHKKLKNYDGGGIVINPSLGGPDYREITLDDDHGLQPGDRVDVLSYRPGKSPKWVYGFKFIRAVETGGGHDPLTGVFCVDDYSRPWAGKPLHTQESALLAAHSGRWRLGPVCEKCGGSGTNYDSPKPGWPKGTYSTNCDACRATGDAGGLMRGTHASTGQIKNAEFDYHYRVEHVRGCLRVHCTLAEAWADGKPTDWIRAACRHHPVVEVWTEKLPSKFREVDGEDLWSFWHDSGRPSSEGAYDGAAPSRDHVLPEGLWLLMQDMGVIDAATPELARLALARAFALAVRLDLEERP